MNILLLYPKSIMLSAPMTWPPLGLWYIAAQLEAQGHKTDFIDMSLDDKLPQDGQYDQMWISANAPQMFEVRKIVTITEKWRKTKTVIGGAGPWANPTAYRELGFNLIVIGEGDHPNTVKSILQLARNQPSDYKTIFSPIAHTDLDWVLPPIRRWSKDYHSYMTSQSGQKYRMASIFTTRGCPMSCAFCESGRTGVIWGNTTRYEPLSVVEFQIKEILQLGFTGIAYYDDIFIMNKHRTLEILKLHKKYGYVPWRCFMRSDILVKHGGIDYLERMKDSGLIELFVGVESADNQIKNNIHKGTTIEQDTKVLEWCKKLGITCKMSFVLGLPGESMESMQKTRDWILKNRPHIAQVDRLIPFPGTPLTEHPEQYDLKYETIPDEEWFFRGKYDENSKSFVSTSHLTREQIDTFWHDLEKTIRDEGLSTYAH